MGGFTLVRDTLMSEMAPLALVVILSDLGVTHLDLNLWVGWQ